MSSVRGFVFCSGVYCGTLERHLDGTFVFAYDPSYLRSPSARPVSLTLPLQEEAYTSPHLFAFFYGLLAEGSLRKLQCQTLKIDEKDDFTLLLKTGRDTIGNVTVHPHPPQDPPGE